MTHTSSNAQSPPSSSRGFSQVTVTRRKDRQRLLSMSKCPGETSTNTLDSSHTESVSHESRSGGTVGGGGELSMKNAFIGSKGMGASNGSQELKPSTGLGKRANLSYSTSTGSGQSYSEFPLDSRIFDAALADFKITKQKKGFQGSFLVKSAAGWSKYDGMQKRNSPALFFGTDFFNEMCRMCCVEYEYRLEIFRLWADTWNILFLLERVSCAMFVKGAEMLDPSFTDDPDWNILVQNTLENHLIWTVDLYFSLYPLSASMGRGGSISQLALSKSSCREDEVSQCCFAIRMNVIQYAGITARIHSGYGANYSLGNAFLLEKLATTQAQYLPAALVSSLLCSSNSFDDSPISCYHFLPSVDSAWGYLLRFSNMWRTYRCAQKVECRLSLSEKRKNYVVMRRPSGAFASSVAVLERNEELCRSLLQEIYVDFFNNMSAARSCFAKVNARWEVSVIALNLYLPFDKGLFMPERASVSLAGQVSKETTDIYDASFRSSSTHNTPSFNNKNNASLSRGLSRCASRGNNNTRREPSKNSSYADSLAMLDFGESISESNLDASMEYNSFTVLPRLQRSASDSDTLVAWARGKPYHAVREMASTRISEQPTDDMKRSGYNQEYASLSAADINLSMWQNRSVCVISALSSFNMYMRSTTRTAGASVVCLSITDRMQSRLTHYEALMRVAEMRLEAWDWFMLLVLFRGQRYLLQLSGFHFSREGGHKAKASPTSSHPLMREARREKRNMIAAHVASLREALHEFYASSAIIHHSSVQQQIINVLPSRFDDHISAADDSVPRRSSLFINTATGSPDQRRTASRASLQADGLEESSTAEVRFPVAVYSSPLISSVKNHSGRRGTAAGVTGWGKEPGNLILDDLSFSPTHHRLPGPAVASTGGGGETPLASLTTVPTIVLHNFAEMLDFIHLGSPWNQKSDEDSAFGDSVDNRIAANHNSGLPDDGGFWGRTGIRLRVAEGNESTFMRAMSVVLALVKEVTIYVRDQGAKLNANRLFSAQRVDYSNGDYYDGEWLGQDRHGIGLYNVGRSGYLFVGCWRANVPHGDGILVKTPKVEDNNESKKPVDPQRPAFSFDRERLGLASGIKAAVRIIFGQWAAGELCMVRDAVCQ